MDGLNYWDMFAIAMSVAGDIVVISSLIGSVMIFLFSFTSLSTRFSQSKRESWLKLTFTSTFFGILGLIAIKQSTYEGLSYGLIIPLSERIYSILLSISCILLINAFFCPH